MAYGYVFLRTTLYFWLNICAYYVCHLLLCIMLQSVGQPRQPFNLQSHECKSSCKESLERKVLCKFKIVWFQKVTNALNTGGV